MKRAKISESSFKKMLAAARKGGESTSKRWKLLNKKSRSEYLSSPKLCKNCKKLLPYSKRKNKFCSHSCSAQYNNRKRFPPSAEQNKKRSRSMKKFWSRLTDEEKKVHVQRAKRRWKNDLKLRAKQSFKLYLYWQLKRAEKKWEDLSLGSKRQILLDEASWKCTSCGFDKVRKDGQHVLQVHHISGDRNDDHRENLVILCPNCHALADGRWKHFGTRGGARIPLFKRIKLDS